MNTNIRKRIINNVTTIRGEGYIAVTKFNPRDGVNELQSFTFNTGTTYIVPNHREEVHISDLKTLAKTGQPFPVEDPSKVGFLFLWYLIDTLKIDLANSPKTFDLDTVLQRADRLSLTEGDNQYEGIHLKSLLRILGLADLLPFIGFSSEIGVGYKIKNDLSDLYNMIEKMGMWNLLFHFYRENIISLQDIVDMFGRYSSQPSLRRRKLVSYGRDWASQNGAELSNRDIRLIIGK